MKTIKLAFAIAGATVFLGTLVSSASARNLSISNQRFNAMWRELIVSGGFGGMHCELTLEGSLHERTIVKRLGTLIGYITSAILGRCIQGTLTISRESLPWHMSYSGFEPRLPEIRSIIVHVTNGSFHTREVFGITCHFRITPEEPLVGRFHREPSTHVLTEVSLGGSIRTGEECFGAVLALSSREGTVSLQGRPEVRISVSLI